MSAGDLLNTDMMDFRARGWTTALDQDPKRVNATKRPTGEDTPAFAVYNPPGAEVGYRKVARIRNAQGKTRSPGGFEWNVSVKENRPRPMPSDVLYRGHVSTGKRAMIAADAMTKRLMEGRDTRTGRSRTRGSAPTKVYDWAAE